MNEIPYRRIVATRFGGPEVLEPVEATLPAPPPGYARLKVLAVGVGFTDLMARSGDYLLQRKAPFTPGYELVGEVADFVLDGPRPHWLREGARVAVALTRMAAYTEYISLPMWQLVPLPDGLDPLTAAAVPLDWITALSVLETHGRVPAGGAVLIHGASGGVGRALSRLGELRGLRMYGTASAAGSEERLARHGVTFIDYRRQDFEAVVRDREPGGVQAVFDHIGGVNLTKGHRLLAPGGVLVSYAFSGRPGRMAADTVRGAMRVKLMNLRPGRRTALSMVPHEIGSDRNWYRGSLERLLDMADRGVIDPEIGAVHPLMQAADVHAALERREITGKVILTVD
ncbi:zinc-binding dehydrogenase [Streptomyces sp. PKU-EA00015]|uniref:zinc-binding dehydrogenase n=1 Tax=Streptomyces sp. PKU-EA00015 TaxID=2748326 RepID=UPI0015A11AF1|nr:zinc-binding dehydrogenase [Streptomyces sp. PKU-EA00015]NWF27261.1 zinc-binding dehydrogenase [Streptomyces sp. PKU-EA00015]